MAILHVNTSSTTVHTAQTCNMHYQAGYSMVIFRSVEDPISDKHETQPGFLVLSNQLQFHQMGTHWDTKIACIVASRNWPL